MGVGAPGRCRLASASLSAANLGLPMLGADRTQHEVGRDTAAVSREDGEGRQPDRHDGDRQRIAPGQPATLLHDGAAHQRRRRDAAGAHQRHQGEQERDQQAESRGGRQRSGIERDPRPDRQHVGDRRLGHERQGRADHEADAYTQRRQGGELDEVGREDQPFRRAQAFQGRDGAQPRRQEARDGIAHAHPADQQGGEADQANELRQPVEPEADAATGIVEAPHPPAGIGKAGLQRRDDRAVRAAGR